MKERHREIESSIERHRHRAADRGGPGLCRVCRDESVELADTVPFCRTGVELLAGHWFAGADAVAVWAHRRWPPPWTLGLARAYAPGLAAHDARGARETTRE